MAADNYQNQIATVEDIYHNADNLTDKIAVLSAINNRNIPLRNKLLGEFANEFAAYPLVMDKWFMLQSQSQLADTLTTVKQLFAHPQFDKLNPNKLYSLVRAFAANPLHFNCHDGYNFIANEILRIDRFNPSVAGRIAHGFSGVTALSKEYQQLALPVLQNILAQEGISNDVYELISKIISQLADY